MTEQTKSQSKRRYARERDIASGSETTPKADSVSAPPREKKIAKVIALLERDVGATLEEMVQSTGWQPHTTRAALTGLKKKDIVIERGKREGVTFYRIAKSA